ncbi:hypothetical protein LCGC14_1080640 [marine sediment metagenome]|uniref:Uncharacterized protein n=1 Tax=marine sediment metagenome TaxID=412755 RepID=A0A0F9MFH0_9ZZZZ
MKIQPIGKGKTQIGSKTAQFDDPELQIEEREFSDWADKVNDRPNNRSITVGQLREWLSSVPSEYTLTISDNGSPREIRETWPDRENQSYVIGI